MRWRTTVAAVIFIFAARLQTTFPGMRSLLLVVHGTGHNYYKAAAEEKVRTASIIWTFIMQEAGVH